MKSAIGGCGTAPQLECGHRIYDRLVCSSELVMIPGSNRLTVASVWSSCFGIPADEMVLEITRS